MENQRMAGIARRLLGSLKIQIVTMLIDILPTVKN